MKAGVVRDIAMIAEIKEELVEVLTVGKNSIVLNELVSNCSQLRKIPDMRFSGAQCL